MKITQKSLTMKRWVLFTTYGWFMGILVIIGLALLAEALINTTEESGGQAIVGIGMGIGVGFMQWMAIRNTLIASGRFFWFTVIGFSFAFILRDFVSEIINTKIVAVPISVEVTIPFAVLLGGLVSGWLQYRFILKKTMDQAVHWISYVVVGWLLATLITMTMPLLSIKTAENFPKVLIVIIALLFLSIGGPILGFITGWFLIPKLKNLTTESTSL
jgi:hypothetical protein